MRAERLEERALLSDPSIKEMIEMIDDAPRAYVEGLETKPRGGLTGLAAPRSVVMYGLGGSGIVGEITKAMLGGAPALPVIPSHDAYIPSWLRREDLLVVISYSGETMEALRAFSEGFRRGAGIAVITSGGSLAREAEARRVPLLRIRGGLPPRMALPQMVGSAVRILTDAELVPGIDSKLRRAAERLSALRASLSASAETDANTAKQAALHVEGALPHVFCAQHLVPAGHRLKNQFSENAKYPCVVHEIPESMHNELEALPYSPRDRYISLRSLNETVDIEAQHVFLSRTLGGDLLEVRLGGDPIYEVAATTMWADYTSIYLAALRGVDPVPVDRIKALRRTLSEAQEKK